MRFPDLMRPPICGTLPNSGARRQLADSADHVCGTLSTWTACSILLFPLPSFSMTKDSNSPATKADIDGVNSRLDRVEATTTVLHSSIEQNARSVKMVNDSVKVLAKGVSQMNRDIDRRFESVNRTLDIVIELIGNIEDRLGEPINSHDKRITRLERHVGLAS